MLATDSIARLRVVYRYIDGERIYLQITQLRPRIELSRVGERMRRAAGWTRTHAAAQVLLITGKFAKCYVA